VRVLKQIAQFQESFELITRNTSVATDMSWI
jgi:hypothetical protein